MGIPRPPGPFRTLLRTGSGLRPGAGRGDRMLGNWTVRRHDAATPPAGLLSVRVDCESPATNLPAALTRLIGRTAAVAQLRDLLSANRVVTLTGPGGIGKSTLALQLARRVLGEFVDGGWLVELASLSDPTLVPATVAGVLGLTIGVGTISEAALAQAVGDNKVLLLFDNCEHVIDVVASLIGTVIRRCPNVAILATSREILRVDGEYAWRVAPLEVPAEDEDDAEQILSRGAVRLFVTRAS